MKASGDKGNRPMCGFTELDGDREGARVFLDVHCHTYRTNWESLQWSEPIQVRVCWKALDVLYQNHSVVCSELTVDKRATRLTAVGRRVKRVARRGGAKGQGR